MNEESQAADPGARLFGADPLNSDEASELLAQGPGGSSSGWASRAAARRR